MPPKTNGKAAPAPPIVDEKPPEPLQAVVLADSYTSTFAPLTVSRPRCLLPLANVPLLAWTLETLSLAGVKEVFVFCTTKADQVKAWLEASEWVDGGMRVNTIVGSNATSTGDVLRELDVMGVIKGDFILIRGDVVSNADLRDAVEAHRERRKVSKDAIMTMVLKSDSLGRSIRPIPSSSVFALHPDTHQLLHYVPTPALPITKRIAIPGSVFDNKWGVDECEVRGDLVDCGIDICSVDIPPLFTENFDFLSPRTDFLPSILHSDLTNSKIYVHLTASYAARARDPGAFDAVSKDILGRWAYPRVPDGHWPVGDDGQDGQYEAKKGGSYVSCSTVLSRTCTVGSRTLLGPQTKILDGAVIHNSIIGSNVTIHPSCRISNSYIFSDSVISAGCVVEGSIVGYGVTLGEGTQVGQGCLIGDDVITGKGADLGEFRRVGRRARRGDDDDDEEEEDEDEEDEDRDENDGFSTEQRDAILGVGHFGFIWPTFDPSDLATDDSDDEPSSDLEDPLAYPPNAALLQLHRTTSRLNLSDSSSTVSMLSQASSASSLHSSNSSDGQAPGLSRVMELGDEPKFREECAATLLHAFEKGGKVDQESLDFAALQIKSARATTNVTPGLVRETVLAYLVDRVQAAKDGKPAREVLKEADALFEVWGGLLERFAEEVSEKVEVLQMLQKLLIEKPELQAYYAAFLTALYNSDVVDTQDLVAWYKHLGSRDTPEMERLAKLAGGFVKQAMENEESSEEGEDESEEESD